MPTRRGARASPRPGRAESSRLGRHLLALLLVGASGAAAHDLWIEPSDCVPPAARRVALGLWSGDGFAGSPVPRNAARTTRFAVLGAAGEQPVEGVEGVHPAGFFSPPEPGPYWVVYETRPRRLVLAAARFESYLRAAGLEAIVERRRRRSESSAAGRESYRRCAKTLIEAGGPASGLGAATAGCPLELLLEAAPGEAAAAGRLAVRLLYRGRPLAGARVAALRRGAPEAPLAAPTDAQGRVAFEVGEPDLWLLKAVHMERAPAGSGEVDWESWWASLTVRLPGPGAPAGR